MKVIDFINIYDNADSKDRVVCDHLKDEYIPFEKKADAAKAITDVCYWDTETDEHGNSKSVLRINSILKYYLTYMTILELFTDLEKASSGKQMLEDFNQLNKRGIIKKIIQNINQDELSEFYSILQMTCDDIVSNEYENHAFITKQVNKYLDILRTLIIPTIENIDLNKIKDIVNDHI